MRIGLDAMGTDRAPVEEVCGALECRPFLDAGDKIVLVGDEAAIRKHLDQADGWREFIEVRPTTQHIRMGDAPVEAVRTMLDSSIVVMAQMHRDGLVDACVSAGNTGACVAAAQMYLRRLRGVHRPGIAVLTPTFHGPVTICDVGANVNCRPQHLHQYGVMASIYARTVTGVQSPRVGLLSVGEEDAKGNDLVKRTRELLRDDPNVNFIGNVEGRDLFRGACEVVVCDGFVGNVVLKLIEGMGASVIRGVLAELTAANPAHALEIKQAARTIVTKYDFNEYGGAPLLGVGGICIICHGASDHRGIMNALRVAKDLVKRQVNQQIVQQLSAGAEGANA